MEVNWKAASCRFRRCKIFCLSVFGAFHTSYFSPSVSLSLMSVGDRFTASTAEEGERD